MFRAPRPDELPRPHVAPYPNDHYNKRDHLTGTSCTVRTDVPETDPAQTATKRIPADSLMQSRNLATQYVRTQKVGMAG